MRVDGIRFEEYSAVRWNDYLRVLGATLLILAGVIAVTIFMGRGPQSVSVTTVVILVLMIFALVTIFRGNLKKEYRKSGVGSMELTYSFTAAGWQVEAGKARNTVAWDKTYRVRKNGSCLMLYPSRKSVNLIPLRCVGKEELSKILSWCAGKTQKT